MAPKLYLFHGSTSVRSVLITAKALGITLEYLAVDYDPEEYSNPEYLKHNPHHIVPTLDDNGQVLWGNKAINVYLVENYGKDDSLYPKNQEKRSVIDARLGYETTNVFPLLRSIHEQIVGKKIRQLAGDTIEEIKKCYDLLEVVLKESPWIAGEEISIADFGLVPATTSLDVLCPIDPESYPAVCAWIRRAQRLPAFDADSVELTKFKEFIRKFLHRRNLT